MSWTKEEKHAVIKVLGDIAGADGKIDYEESKIISETMSALGMNVAELQTIMRKPVIDSLATLSVMDKEKQIQMANSMKEMMFADGKVHEKEMKMLKTALGLMGIGMKIS